MDNVSQVKNFDPEATNKVLQKVVKRPTLIKAGGYKGMAENNIESWFYEKRDNNIDITVNALKSEYKVIGVAKEMPDAVIFVARKGDEVCLVKFNKYDEIRTIHSESGKIYTDIPMELMAREEVQSLKGYGAILPIDYLFPLRMLNPNLDINLSEIKHLIKHIAVDEAVLPVTDVLGAGRMGLVLEVKIDDPWIEPTDEEDNLFVFKVGVTDTVIDDLNYELQAQGIVAGRLSPEVVPFFKYKLSNIALLQDTDHAPFKYGKAITMPKVKKSEALSSWDRSDRSSAEDVLGAYLHSAIMSNEMHLLGGVNGDAHSKNMLHIAGGGQVMIDFDQFRFVDFDFTLGFQLLISEEMLPNPAKLQLALAMCNKIKHFYMQFGLSELDLVDIDGYINKLNQILMPGKTHSISEQDNLIADVVEYLITNSIDEIAYNRRNPQPVDSEDEVNLKPFVIAMNTEIADIIKTFGIKLNWNQVLKQRPDLLIAPKNDTDYFTVVHARAANHAIYNLGILDRDFNAIAAAENRTKVLELMHALKLPFYTRLFDYDKKEWFPLLSGKDWDMNSPESLGYQLIPSHFPRTLTELNNIFRSGDYNSLFVPQDFFVADASVNSKLAGLSAQKLKVIHKLLRNYFVEYDLIYTWKQISPEEAKYSNVIELIQQIIRIVSMDDSDIRLSTDEVEELSVSVPLSAVASLVARDANGEPLAEQPTEVLRLLGIES